MFSFISFLFIIGLILLMTIISIAVSIFKSVFRIPFKIRKKQPDITWEEKFFTLDGGEYVDYEEIKDEMDVLRDTFKKKYKEERFNIQNQKMVSYLLRKGFSWDLIEQFERNESEKYK